MISLEDRQLMAQHVEQAHRDHAPLKVARASAASMHARCSAWKSGAGLQRGDARPQAVAYISPLMP